MNLLLFLSLVVVGCFTVNVAGNNMAIYTFGSQKAAAQLTTFDVDQHEIIGITWLCGKLYVVCASTLPPLPEFYSEVIYVFDDVKPYKRLAIIRIPALRKLMPSDIKGDCENKLLYILAFRHDVDGGSVIWKVDPFAKPGPTAVLCANATHWTGTIGVTPKEKKPFGVSGDGMLNTCDCEKHTCTHVKLTTKDPKCADHLIDTPQSAIQLKDGTYYVTQGWTTDEPNKLYYLNKNLQILQDYGQCLPGNKTNEFNHPRFITRGPCGKTILLIDYWNRRVLSFDKQLNGFKTLLIRDSPPGFGYPERMTLAPIRAVKSKKAGDCCFTCSNQRNAYKLFVSMTETGEDDKRRK